MTTKGLARAWEVLRHRGGTWVRRSPREWLWAIRRRLFPERTYRFRFDNDLQLETCLRDELGIAYALGRESEPEICAFFRRVVKPGMVVFDIGANIGQFTLLAAKNVGPSGSVHSFEPGPEEYHRLCDNVRLNRFGQVHTVQKAICDQEGHVAFHTCSADGLGAYNSLGKPFREANIQTVRVQATTLDRYVEAHGIGYVDLVKMDIEGAEMAALCGGSRLFSGVKAPLLVCEFSDPAAAGMGHTTRDLRRALEQLGYAIFRYNMESQGLEPEPSRDRYDYDNLICVKNVPGHGLPGALALCPLQNSLNVAEKGC